MTKYNQQKRQESLDWLRSRGRYVLDNRYVPTSSTNTDVSKTFKRIKKEIKHEH